jgi:hypothetical protein
MGCEPRVVRSCSTTHVCRDHLVDILEHEGDAAQSSILFVGRRQPLKSVGPGACAIDPDQISARLSDNVSRGASASDDGYEPLRLQ